MIKVKSYNYHRVGIKYIDNANVVFKNDKL